MDRGELASRVANRTELGHMGTLLTVDVVFEVIGEALAQKEDVTIMNFGRITMMDRSARTGRNPRTGETLEIPASAAPVFKPASRALRGAVNGR